MEVINATTIMEIGFEVIFSDQIGNRYSHYLPNSTARSYDFNSTVVEAAGLLGTNRVVIVAVVTEVGMFSSSSSKFSGE